jgi:hypothetical protein
MGGTVHRRRSRQARQAQPTGQGAVR